MTLCAICFQTHPPDAVCLDPIQFGSLAVDQADFVTISAMDIRPTLRIDRAIFNELIANGRAELSDGTVIEVSE